MMSGKLENLSLTMMTKISTQPMKEDLKLSDFYLPYYLGYSLFYHKFHIDNNDFKTSRFLKSDPFFKYSSYIAK